MRGGGRATFREFCNDVNIVFATQFHWHPSQVDELMLEDFWGLLEWLDKSNKKADAVDMIKRTSKWRQAT